ncbi:ribulose-bisphosphate carboxylase large subunit family protein [Pararhodonellum marinum]|uniref:ribulose-bisphosphate carboxylase large subunit family protein n=1 Tax=Pararhodonellum marinum TaxID=2755358 RepID=UPI00188F65DD|nr:ribulose-bisphosphate carboxylase large subunit family protein [Pararhodonellum marinum]
MDRFTATYWIETDFPLEKAINMMAGEQSTGTFVKVPGETSKVLEQFAAKVETIKVLGEVKAPSLPFSRRFGGPILQAEVTLSWPLANVGFNLSNLMATVAGNLFELAPFSGLKLLDISIPEAFRKKYTGSKFGIEGTFQLAGVQGRPIIGTIIKPSVGLDAKSTAQQVKILVEAGLDFIKDDELMGSPTYNRFEDRVKASMKVINDHALRTGIMPMYAFNVSGSVDEMLARHDYVLEQGGTCIMASLNWVGLAALEKLAEHSQLPIHGHRNGWGLFSRHPAIGISFTALSKIWRLAGIDHLHVNGLRNKFCEPDESVLKSIQALQSPLWTKSDRALPVVSSGQWASQAFDTYNAVGNTELMYLCGGGIMGHPDGMVAGVNSIKEAWQAAIEGLDAAAAQAKFPSVKKAFEFFEK